ncbi:hypothetical protein ABIE26_005325 [Pedobacter africanus]|uniref:Uncharacterized protein n=1 Tax=Pedobacter africanus TaxID=151894 RepID=A0ACC6L511_9SPHI|nr:hypothetical protein [Pedobacter africanus]MDR6786488.1 hypothetical protein [Pedobacter africanus]
MALKIIIAIVLVLICAVVLSSCYGTRKTLLSENRVYHWKVYLVKKSHFSIGTYQHFEVYYKGNLLVLPKEITDGSQEISEFITAVALDNRYSQFGTVAVIFEGHFTREDGVPYRAMVTLHIRPGKGNELVVTNPCSGKEAVIDSK